MDWPFQLPEKYDPRVLMTISQESETPHTPKQKQVAHAAAVCASVAKLYRRYGGPAPFRVQPTTSSLKTDEPVKAPRGAYQIKRTIRGLA
jgi:hypothetical protein